MNARRLTRRRHWVRWGLPVAQSVLASIVWLGLTWAYLKFRIAPETIDLGFTHHPVDFNVDGLAREYNAYYAVPANQRADLADRVASLLRRPLDFHVKVSEPPYSNIWWDLESRRIDVAFVSPIPYLTRLKASMDNTREYKDEIVELGQLYRSKQSTYRSGFVFKKLTSVERLNADGFRSIKGRWKQLILNSEELSTSTRVVPSLVLLEWGWDDLVADAMVLQREGIIDTIRRSDAKDGWVGVLSNEDWQRLNRESEARADGLGFVAIDSLPIPFDVVVARKSLFGSSGSPLDPRLSDDERKQLVHAMRPSMNPLHDEGKDWIKRHRAFAEYVSSGVVVRGLVDSRKSETSRAGTYYVLMPGQISDFCNTSRLLRDTQSHRVWLWRFGREVGPGSEYTLTRSTVGTGLLRWLRTDGRGNAYVLDSLDVDPGSEILGLHIFPADTVLSNCAWCRDSAGSTKSVIAREAGCSCLRCQWVSAIGFVIRKLGAT